MLTLVVQFVNEESLYTLEKESYTVGRNDTNEIVIKDSTVSGKHCEIRVSDNSINITDIGSKNGTIVNGKKITSTETIHTGDIFSIGMRLCKLENINENELINLTQLSQNHFIREIKNEEQLFDFEDSHDDDSDSIVRKISFKNIEKKNINIDKLLTDKDKKENINKEYNKLSIIYEMANSLNSVFEEDELFNLTLEWIKKGLNYDRGYILLLDSENNFKCAANSSDNDKIFISRTIAKTVIEEQSAIITLNAATDSRFSTSQSIVNLQISAAMCVPIWDKEKPIGLIYIDNSISTAKFTDEDLKFLTAFSTQLSISVERVRLMKALQHEEKVRSSLKRYLSPDVADILIKNPEISNKLGGQKSDVSVLFADIRGFTTLSLNTPVDILVTILNEYFSVLVDIVFKHNGTIDKFIGDAVMAVFGAPLSYGNDAENAINSSLEFLLELKKLNHKWREQYNVSFDIGIGISTGQVIAGNIGSTERMDYTIIGNTVNLASRICSYSPPKKIYVCQKTQEQTIDTFGFTKLQSITFKGFNEPVFIYDVEPII